MVPSRSLVTLALALAGCGSGGSEVPPELLDAIRDSERAAGTGTAVGDVVEDLCFDGWVDPAGAGFDVEAMTELCLYDFRDPDGEGVELLLVNASAVWCTSCKLEYGGSSNRPSLLDRHASLGPRGLKIFGTLFESGNDEPATREDAATWARLYDVSFPFAVDPTFQIGNFTTPGQAPFNMLVDARTMKILLQLEGDQPAVLFTTIEDVLQDRER
jgi:hypothetical protein